MKKALYFIVPIVLIFVASRFFGGNNQGANGSNSAYCNLSANEYKETDTEGAVILDVRTQREFDNGHLENAMVIDIYKRDFRDKIAQLDKTKTYYVYCLTGVRSRSAVNFMMQSGFAKVCNLEGGVSYLNRAGVKLVR